MEVASFFHVACKTDDVDESVAFYRQHLDADQLERGYPESKTGPEAVEYAALAVGDKGGSTCSTARPTRPRG